MPEKLLIIFCIYITVTGCVNTRPVIARDQHDIAIIDTSVHEQRQLMKGYALCQCILGAYKNDSTSLNDVSLSFYYDQSLYGENARVKVERFANDFARTIVPSKYPDYKGKRAVIYFCTQFYNSKTLDSLIISLDSDIMK